MKKFLSIASMAVLLLLQIGCSSGGGTMESATATGDTQTQFEQVYKQAEDAYKKVKDAGGAWAYTEDTLKEARQAADAKDYDKATKLAKNALEESEIARVQFEGQKQAGPYLF
jgi:hypothetical protein